MASTWAQVPSMRRMRNRVRSWSPGSATTRAKLSSTFGRSSGWIRSAK